MSRAPAGTPTGLNSTAFTSVNTIVFKPIPKASVTTTAAENHRWARIMRRAKRRSWAITLLNERCGLLVPPFVIVFPKISRQPTFSGYSKKRSACAARRRPYGMTEGRFSARAEDRLFFGAERTRAIPQSHHYFPPQHHRAARQVRSIIEATLHIPPHEHLLVWKP